MFVHLGMKNPKQKQNLSGSKTKQNYKQKKGKETEESCVIGKSDDSHPPKIE